MRMFMMGLRLSILPWEEMYVAILEDLKSAKIHLLEYYIIEEGKM